MLSWLTENWNEVVAAITAVVLAARIIVKLTPTDKDNKALGKVIAFLKAVGLHVTDDE